MRMRFYDRTEELQDLREMKRQRKKYSPALLESKVAEMQKHLFKGKVIQTACLSLEDM